MSLKNLSTTADIFDKSHDAGFPTDVENMGRGWGGGSGGSSEFDGGLESIHEGSMGVGCLYL